MSSVQIALLEEYILSTDKAKHLEKLRATSPALAKDLTIHYCLKTNSPFPEEYKHLDNLQKTSDAKITLTRILEKPLTEKTLEQLKEYFFSHISFKHNRVDAPKPKATTEKNKPQSTHIEKGTGPTGNKVQPEKVIEPPTNLEEHSFENLLSEHLYAKKQKGVDHRRKRLPGNLE